MATGITKSFILIKRVDRSTITCELIDLEDTLSELYRVIECRTIDIVQRSFGGVIFDIVLDDEGLLKANDENLLPTSWWQHEGFTPPYEGLFGNLLLAHHDELGNLTSVNDITDLLAVQSCYRVIPTDKGELGLLFHDLN